MKSHFTEAYKARVNLVRRQLLLTDVHTPRGRFYKYGIAFVLKQREQSNVPRMVRHKIETEPCRTSNTPSKHRAFPFPNKRVMHENVLCSPSGIKRMTISKKKFERNKMNLKKIEGRPAKEEEKGKVWSAKDLTKDALMKIHSLGLLMRELRGKKVNKRAKSMDGRKRTRNISLLAKHEMRVNEREEVEVMHGIRKNSIAKVYETITNFVKTLLKETKKGDDKEVGKPLKTRRRSSYYSNLSEGSITEEELF
eukprot:TRINITY_DN12163_c0_g1_i1.p1 TRINITY_DN12163_c0_g1~~TRINITY_DN12163_c0_g1_i1.p1  ORF type:complete len:252 (+),score=42.69 TRINITY_DN12163_c0_g1_i1:174-929(+)